LFGKLNLAWMRMFRILDMLRAPAAAIQNQIQ
jgi:hypothetical protein